MPAESIAIAAPVSARASSMFCGVAVASAILSFSAQAQSSHSPNGCRSPKSHTTYYRLRCAVITGRCGNLPLSRCAVEPTQSVALPRRILARRSGKIVEAPRLRVGQRKYDRDSQHALQPPEARREPAHAAPPKAQARNDKAKRKAKGEAFSDSEDEDD